jgi:pimeloyl-ACP methyl ester carboxylesterase
MTAEPRRIGRVKGRRLAEATGVAVVQTGTGPEVLLVHGGASPATTWRGLEPLRDRWTLAYVHRRGYPPSPPPPGPGSDFDVDADDLEPLLAGRPHVVAHSYGTIGAVIAALRRPTDVRSLTLIEPPFYIVDDPDVHELRRMGDEVLAHGLQTDSATLRAFLRLAGSPGVEEDGPLPDDVARAVRRSHGGRSPSEAHLDVAALRATGIPILVASGAHAPAPERICEALAAQLVAPHVVAPGAGHFVAAAPMFANRLERFLASVG